MGGVCGSVGRGENGWDNNNTNWIELVHYDHW